MKYVGEEIIQQIVDAGVGGPVQWVDGYLHGIDKLDPRERMLVEQIQCDHVPSAPDPLIATSIIVNRLESLGLLDKFANALAPGDALILACRGRQRQSWVRQLLSTAGIDESLYGQILSPD